MSAIEVFQDTVWNDWVSGATEEQSDVLNDLALDLDYYEPDPRLREGIYYDDSRLEAEITEALQKAWGGDFLIPELCTCT
jgi:hypothetical protein